MRIALPPDEWTPIGRAPLCVTITTTPSEIVYRIDGEEHPLESGQLIVGEGQIEAKALDHPSSVTTRPPNNDKMMANIASLPALPIPSYMIDALPLASMHNNCVVRIIDNPQGQAESNGLDWISTVDGSNLGPGHG